MGDGYVSGSSPYGGGASERSAPITYTSTFEERLPFFMAIGMSWDEFWNQDCEIARFYLKAHDLKRKMENEKLWMQGAYIYDALCAVSPVLNAFAKTGTKPLPYAKEPYPLTAKEVKEVQDSHEKQLMSKGREKMMAWMAKTNTARKKLEQEVMKDGRDDG